MRCSGSPDHAYGAWKNPRRIVRSASSSEHRSYKTELSTRYVIALYRYPSTQVHATRRACGQAVYKLPRDPRHPHCSSELDAASSSCTTTTPCTPACLSLERRRLLARSELKTAYCSPHSSLRHPPLEMRPTSPQTYFTGAMHSLLPLFDDAFGAYSRWLSQRGLATTAEHPMKVVARVRCSRRAGTGLPTPDGDLGGTSSGMAQVWLVTKLSH